MGRWGEVSSTTGEEENKDGEENSDFKLAASDMGESCTMLRVLIDIITEENFYRRWRRDFDEALAREAVFCRIDESVIYHLCGAGCRHWSFSSFGEAGERCRETMRL